MTGGSSSSSWILDPGSYMHLIGSRDNIPSTSLGSLPGMASESHPASMEQLLQSINSLPEKDVFALIDRMHVSVEVVGRGKAYRSVYE